MNHRKERSFLLGVKGELFFLSQKRKAPLKTSLFHLVFTDVNTPFVHVVNSPLFFEQQKRFRATWSQNRLKPKWFYKVLNPKRFLNASFACRMYHKPCESRCTLKFALALCRLCRRKEPSLPRERT